jgi:hypothetical protein
VYHFLRSLNGFGKTLLSFAIMLGVAMAVTLAFAAGGGNVLPPNANPHGYSLDDMTLKMALFQTSGNQAQYYPQTPFQILHTDPDTPPTISNIVCPDSGEGILVTNHNAFVVRSGTPFFVPLWSVDDSPPVIPPFPVQPSMGGYYFFDPQGVGGRDFEVIVDGQSVKLGPAYVGGPITAPLLNGGSHMVLLGAFLSLMSPGTHSVTIKGKVAGAGILQYYGMHCIGEDIQYLVRVEPGPRAK